MSTTTNERQALQGVGWAALEELKWGDKAHPWIKPGLLLTNGALRFPCRLCGC